MFFLNHSRTTQEGSQELWDYPHPTLDVPRDPKQHQKPSNSSLSLKPYEKHTKLPKSAQQIEKNPKDDQLMDWKCKNSGLFPNDDWLMDWKYKKQSLPLA